MNKSREESINIPKGVDTGQNLRVAQKVHASESGSPSVTYLSRLVVKPHAVFQRNANGIMSDVSVPVWKAVLGGSVDLEKVQSC